MHHCIAFPDDEKGISEIEPSLKIYDLSHNKNLNCFYVNKLFDFINSNCLDEHNIIFTVALFSNLKYVLICFVFLYYFSDYFDAGIDMLKQSLTEITTNAVWKIQEPGISVVKLTEEILKIMESDEAKDYSLVLCTQILGILKFHGPPLQKERK